MNQDFECPRCGHCCKSDLARVGEVGVWGECEPQEALEDGWCDWVCPARQEHEPVAWISHSQNLLSWDKFYDDMTPLYTAPQPTQPEQEPVAVVFDPYDAHGLQWLCQHPPHRGDKLYLSPPKREWVGLTDEEINSVRHKRDWTAPWTDTTFARAIEAKLKEKNTHDAAAAIRSRG